MCPRACSPSCRWSFPGSWARPTAAICCANPQEPDGNEPEHVVVLSTIGAERRGMLGRRSRTRRTDSEPASVPVARATVVDPVPLSLETQASAWLAAARPRARGARRRKGAQPRSLRAPHRRRDPRTSTRSPPPRRWSCAPASARASRSPTGCGATRASWCSRVGGPASAPACCALRSALRCCCPGAASVLLCEELALRARLDLDQGRLELAAIELDRAYRGGTARAADRAARRPASAYRGAAEPECGSVCKWPRRRQASGRSHPRRRPCAMRSSASKPHCGHALRPAFGVVEFRKTPPLPKQAYDRTHPLLLNTPHEHNTPPFC